MTKYGETRAYMTATLEIGGNVITLINTHLCYLTPAVKYQQMKELFNRAEKSLYTVVTGDFNCFDGESDRMYKQFVDAGYHLANCNPRITKTWTDKTNPHSLSSFTYPTDNIIVSRNITIKQVRFDKTKLEYPTGDMIDHIPIIVRLHV